MNSSISKHAGSEGHANKTGVIFPPLPRGWQHFVPIYTHIYENKDVLLSVRHLQSSDIHFKYYLYTCRKYRIIISCSSLVGWVDILFQYTKLKLYSLKIKRSCLSQSCPLCLIKAFRSRTEQNKYNKWSKVISRYPGRNQSILATFNDHRKGVIVTESGLVRFFETLCTFRLLKYSVLTLRDLRASSYDPPVDQRRIPRRLHHRPARWWLPGRCCLTPYMRALSCLPFFQYHGYEWGYKPAS